MTGTATLIVTLTDVNDNFPVFAENYRPVIYENEPPGQFVVRKLTSAIFMFEMLLFVTEVVADWCRLR